MIKVTPGLSVIALMLSLLLLRNHSNNEVHIMYALRNDILFN